MALPNQQSIDLIATQILLDAKQALLSLKAFNNSVTNSQQKLALFRALIESVAKQMNGDFNAATSAVTKFASALNINPAMIRKIGKDLAALDKIAQKSLGGMGQATLTANARMTLLSNAIQAMATRSKMSIAQVVSSLRTLNASMGTRFGKLGFSDQQIVQAGKAAQLTANQMIKVGQAAQTAGGQVTSGFGRMLNPINLARVALGTLEAMVLFRVINAFEELARRAIEHLEEIEVATFNLINAEQKLSEMGIEVTPTDLDDLIKKLQVLSPMLSEFETTEIVGAIATKVAPLFGLGLEEIESLSQSIVLLTARNMAMGKSFDEVMNQVMTGILSGQVTRGINSLGVKITEQIVLEKALEMQLIETEKQYRELAAEQQERINVLAITAILEENTQKELENFSMLLDTSTGAAEQARTALDNLITDIGKQLAPVLIELFTYAAEALKEFSIQLKANQEAVEEFMAIVAGLVRAYKTLFVDQTFLERLTNPIDSLKELLSAFAGGYNDAKEGILELREAADTPTGPPKVYKGIEENEDALKALDDLDEKLQDIMLDAQQAQEDLDLKLEQKQSDLDLEYIRKAEDAAVDHNQKLEDINQDAIDKAEDAKNKARENELKAEEDLLQKLKELRQRFLLDLEDALRARDARQVIRLIKEYKLDKQNILDRARLDEEQRKRSLEEDLRAIEIERQRRIAQENIEYQRRLADLATAKAREQEELALWYKREQDDIQRNIEQKIQKLLAGYIAEEKLHAEHQAKIADIIAKYVGYDMAMVDRLAQFMANRFAFMSGLVAQPGSLNYGLGSSTNPFAGSYADPLGGSTGGGTRVKGTRTAFAEGGTLLANRPTTVMFGERGPEAATFTPLSRTGLDVGKVFGDIEGGGVNGTIMVAVELSPDLEGRVVRRSMDGVANIISRVNNRKM